MRRPRSSDGTAALMGMVLPGCMVLLGCGSSSDGSNAAQGTLNAGPFPGDTASGSSWLPAPAASEPNSDSTSGSSPAEASPTGPLTDDLDLVTVIQDPPSTPASCASTTATGELQELALTFAFDVSGSMGKGDEAYHDKALKWDPVVAASKAFFSSSEVSRVSASLVFFPAGGESGRCSADSYAAPDVALTPLPSSAFGKAIDEVTPKSTSDWRGGTPTLAVLNASAEYVRGLLAAGSTAKHAIVLVTDGMPQGCDDADDDIEAVAAAAAEARDIAPTYVIGIANPITDEEPEPPDNVSNLTRIAEQGGTQEALLIDTGDPTRTIAEFREIIETIRTRGLSCEIPIPEAPSGQTFDKERVNVTLVDGGMARGLTYSPDCATGDTWRFNDAATPTTIVLCAETCAQTKKGTSSSLEVEFGCERRVAAAR